MIRTDNQYHDYNNASQFFEELQRTQDRIRDELNALVDFNGSDEEKKAAYARLEKDAKGTISPHEGQACIQYTSIVKTHRGCLTKIDTAQSPQDLEDVRKFLQEAEGSVYEAFSLLNLLEPLQKKYALKLEDISKHQFLAELQRAQDRIRDELNALVDFNGSDEEKKAAYARLEKDAKGTISPHEGQACIQYASIVKTHRGCLTKIDNAQSPQDLEIVRKFLQEGEGGVYEAFSLLNLLEPLQKKYTLKLEDISKGSIESSQ